MGSAAPVGDASVKRLDRQASVGLSGHEGMKPPPQSVDLDDIADLNPLEPHVLRRVEAAAPGTHPWAVWSRIGIEPSS